MKAALFDLDGTLLDTRDMILGSFRYAYTKVLGPKSVPPEEQLLSLVGIPLVEQMRLIDPERSDELFEAYLEHNANTPDEMIKGFEGTAEALTQLQEQGLRMAVVTSKRHDPAIRGLELRGLLPYFEFVLGSNDTVEHKPHPGPLLQAAERMCLAPDDCSYVGDSPYDMQSAVGAGMFAVGALWGMFSGEVLRGAGAQVLIPSVANLPGVYAA